MTADIVDRTIERIPAGLTWKWTDVTVQRVTRHEQLTIDCDINISNGLHCIVIKYSCPEYKSAVHFPVSEAEYICGLIRQRAANGIEIVASPRPVDRSHAWRDLVQACTDLITAPSHEDRLREIEQLLRCVADYQTSE